jgi:hypothetical protein
MSMSSAARKASSASAILNSSAKMRAAVAA